MSRRAARCTQADIARALRAAKQENSPVAVEITPDGTIRLVPVQPAPAHHKAKGTPIEPERIIRL
jgi:hypothetical protein